MCHLCSSSAIPAPTACSQSHGCTCTTQKSEFNVSFKLNIKGGLNFKTRLHIVCILPFFPWSRQPVFCELQNGVEPFPECEVATMQWFLIRKTKPNTGQKWRRSAAGKVKLQAWRKITSAETLIYDNIHSIMKCITALRYCCYYLPVLFT